MSYTDSFPIEFQGRANADSLVVDSGVRFTVLSARLLRLEYDPLEQFEDRPSQAFWYRRQPAPAFEVRRDDGRIEVETEFLHLYYTVGDAGFTAETLSITLKESGTIWHYGQQDDFNLLGTARTLDDVDGALKLEPGLISRSGWAVCDDSNSLVFDDHGWLQPRQGAGQALDLYFFGFGRDFEACLADFAAVAGAAPMVPRWALGNWWSRYWAYSDEELLRLMDDFRAHQVPLSVCIVDMDWHITNTGNASSGWTGYTWNRDLCSDPAAFIEQLHRRGLKTALNLHPADGLHPHEEMYPAMCERLGLDVSSNIPIPFDIADPEFASAYFELLHHPREAEGVDFWWVDWQQGKTSGLTGLDPLWWLNHLHFYDLARDGRRPFVFSRWGGLGNHRYPIGFSGDTHVTWGSLAFQPYFTATAANVNYGWWSHDIGGHMGGIEDPELFARWVQFGVFSPIFRLHSTNNPYHERRPWAYDSYTAQVTSDAMRLRHALIPYLYSMAWRNHVHHKPLVRPMYHACPAEDAAYRCPDQYFFGSELIVAPFIAPAGHDTAMSRQVAWLPQGDWFDFFNGARYPGDSWHSLYGRLQDIPVFAKAGAIVPLADGATWGATGHPERIALHLFPGADNDFVLYEDDGHTAGCKTLIRQRYSSEKWQVSIDACNGEVDALPAERTFELRFRATVEDVTVTAAKDGHPVDVTTRYEPTTKTTVVNALAKKPHETLIVTITAGEQSLEPVGDYRLDACRRMIHAFKFNSWVKQRLDGELTKIIENPELLAHYELELTDEQFRAFAETLTGCGYHRASVRHTSDEAIVLWNNDGTGAATYRMVAEDFNGRLETHRGQLPRFAVLLSGHDRLKFHRGGQLLAGHMTTGEWFDALEDRLADEAGSLPEAFVQFDIQGAHGRSAYLSKTAGGQVKLTDGQCACPDVTISAHNGDWLALINGEIDPENAFLAGRLNVSGSIELAIQLASKIRLTPPNTYRANRWRLDVSYLGTQLLQLGSEHV